LGVEEIPPVYLVIEVQVAHAPRTAPMLYACLRPLALLPPACSLSKTGIVKTGIVQNIALRKF
jgi:hypothetical protein